MLHSPGLTALCTCRWHPPLLEMPGSCACGNGCLCLWENKGFAFPVKIALLFPYVSSSWGRSISRSAWRWAWVVKPSVPKMSWNQQQFSVCWAQLTGLERSGIPFLGCTCSMLVFFCYGGQPNIDTVMLSTYCLVLQFSYNPVLLVIVGMGFGRKITKESFSGHSLELLE